MHLRPGRVSESTRRAVCRLVGWVWMEGATRAGESGRQAGRHSASQSASQQSTRQALSAGPVSVCGLVGWVRMGG